MGYRPHSWGRFGRVPDPPEPPEDDDRKCMRCKHCIERGPGWANPYGCDAWTCEFEEKEKKRMKAAIATGMNMRYAPEIRSITIRTEDKGGHRTLSLADEKAGTMLLVAITPEVEKVLKEIIK